MKDGKKYFLQCKSCSAKIESFRDWFHSGQRCPGCGSAWAEVRYLEKIEKLKPLLDKKAQAPGGLWRYFDFLPVNKAKNIVTAGEGIVPIERWKFLEEYALERFRLRCRVYAHRHDDNYATGTFKDLSGSVVASVLKENGVRSYVVASTGNIAVSYARYLTEAGVSLYAFIPAISSRSQEAEIGCFGQQVFRVKGDYNQAKEMAFAFSQEHKILLAAGNFDPMRVEAKKTMLLEWLRTMEDVPTVYIQALSGGTGPLAIAKGWEDLSPLNVMKKIPRFILVQSNKCAPMADAWEEAKTKGFPEGWEKTYPIYHNPETMIPTLATGYPKTYPALGPLVRKSQGEIMSCNEQAAIALARLVAFKRSVRIGPAAAIVVGGFIKALRKGYLRAGDTVMLNIGEGIRRAPDFQEKLIPASKAISSVEECALSDKRVYEKKLWQTVEKDVS